MWRRTFRFAIAALYCTLYKYFEYVEEEISFCSIARPHSATADDEPSLNLLERDESIMCKTNQSGFNGDESAMFKIN